MTGYLSLSDNVHKLRTTVTCKINSFLVSAMRGPHSPLLPLTVTGMAQLVSS